MFNTRLGVLQLADMSKYKIFNILKETSIDVLDYIHSHPFQQI